MVVSPPTVSEVVEVIRRPAVLTLFRPIPDRDPAAVEALLADAEWVEIDPDAMPRVSRDRKDDKFVATAVAGGAAYVVSEDKDLLVLGTYEGIRIVDAAAFLRVLDETGDGGTVA